MADKNTMNRLLQNLLVMLGMALCLNLGAAERYFSQRDQQMVTQLMKAYDDALQKADADALTKVLADDYSFVDATGSALNKSAEVEGCRSGDLKIESLSRAGTSIRLYVGGAMATGTLSIKGKYKKEDLSGDYRFVQVFEPKPGATWQVVFAQLTKIPEKK